jgi:hypothetical protein
MDKGLGFIRNIKLDWLDAAAAYAPGAATAKELRARLEPVVAADRTGPDAVRKSLDVLVAIWFKSRDLAPDLYEQALTIAKTTQTPTDRLWLHYGLTTLTYPFFRRTAGIIGQLARTEETITRRQVIDRLAAELGSLGSLKRSAERVMASLQDWGILRSTDRRDAYAPAYRSLATDSLELQAWLLACALRAEPDRAVAFADLVRLPMFFPFRITLTAGELRRRPGFEVERQGIDLEMVRYGD